MGENVNFKSQPIKKSSLNLIYKLQHNIFNIVKKKKKTCIFCTKLPWWLSSKESPCQFRRLGFHPWVGKIPWRNKWESTPVLLPGESYGQRSLAGDSVGSQKVRHN